MRSKQHKQRRRKAAPTRPMKTVYVIGAGFSRELGYPLTQQLLHLLPNGIDEELKKIVRFHHPRWDERIETLPDIEELLTALSVNEELLPVLEAGGEFNEESVRTARSRLLRQIAEWFHQIHNERTPQKEALLHKFWERHAREATVIISFNWDYELDRKLFNDEPTRANYGLNGNRRKGRPVLLKPHGSLNWYLEPSAQHLSDNRTEALYRVSGDGEDESVYRFLPWRAQKSKSEREYVPWIVPPTHFKRFRHPMLRELWDTSVRALSTAKRVYFLGYSQPEADWHSRYILRCGFYNQENGAPHNGTRRKATGQASVIVVNPDPGAFHRIETTVGWQCQWIPSSVGEWLNAD